MAKSRILKVVNYREEDIPILQELEGILKREGKEYTEWVRDESREYVKAHAAGNPTFKLDQFVDPGFAAYPTPWGKPLGYSDLGSFSWKEEDLMIAKLEKTLSVVKRDRQAKRDADMKAEGLVPRSKGG